MSKNIILCADGTWNGPGKADNEDKTSFTTNVFKLFLNLAGVNTSETVLLGKEQEKVLINNDGTTKQLAKYLHGVGDSDNFLVKLMGGTLGAGIITRIVRGYTFISRNYMAGDNIFLIGFSRGAYTVRALAGLISAKGLLDATQIDLTNKNQAYRLGSAVWYDYRRSYFQANTNWLENLEQAILDLPSFLIMKPPSHSQFISAQIKAIAVWDTVGSLGIPKYTSNRIRIDLFQFADKKLSSIVQKGIQAIAVDEQRNDFTPTLWDADPRIIQALFPGAHADVGGGYPSTDNESGLSDRTLQWMIDQLVPLEVQFVSPFVVVPKPDAKGTAHQPWVYPPWNILLRRSRIFPSGLCLAKFVLNRMQSGPVIANPGSPARDYAPTNLGGYIINGNTLPNIVIV